MAVAANGDVVTSARNAVANGTYVAWKLAKSTGKAAWIASTTFLLLVAPLIVEMDREQQMLEFENQSLGALTSNGSGAALLRAGYRQVLRVHRDKLPPPMRSMGDAYAAQEFRAWGKAANLTPAQWQEFQSQWERYTAMLLGVADSPSAASGDIPDEVLSHMTPEQKQQLAALREAVTT